MRPLTALMFASVMLASATVQAQTSSSPRPFTFGPTIGTLGAGLEAGWRASPYLGVRLDASGLPFDTNRTIDGVPYKFNATLASGGAVLDFYPFGGGFRLTGGARINGNRADVTSTPNMNVTINGDTFTPAELGTLTGSVAYNRVAPYLGVGFSGGVTSWLVLGFDVGVLYQGRPRVSLAATGPFANNPTLQADVEQQRAAIQHDINFTAWYPAVTLSALIRF